MQWAGGQAARGVVDVYPGKVETPTVGMRFSRMNALLGITIPPEKVMAIFQGLGFNPEMKTDDLVVCTIPTWRHDIYREVDLIEEAARCWGYDKIPTERKIHIEAAPKDKRQTLASRLRTVLTGCGFYETVTVSFVEPELAAVFSDLAIEQHLAVQDVNQKSSRILRSTLMASLAGVMRSNYNAGNTACSLFELADTYKPNQAHPDKLPIQRTQIGLVTDGDFRQLRGVIEGIIEAVNAAAKVECKPAEYKWAQAGAEVLMDARPGGGGGVRKADLAKRFDLDRAGQVCVAELDFDMLLESIGGIVTVKPIPKFPAICRDLSLIVAEPVKWSDILSTLQTCWPAQLEKVDFVTLYRGKPIPAGQKSVTVSLVFRDDDGTLRHDQVDVFEKTILETLNQKLGVQIRTT